MQRYTVYFIWKLLYMFQVVPPPIIRSAKNCIYSVWYFSDRYCYLPLSTIAAGSSNIYDVQTMNKGKAFPVHATNVYVVEVSLHSF